MTEEPRPTLWPGRTLSIEETDTIIRALQDRVSHLNRLYGNVDDATLDEVLDSSGLQEALDAQFLAGQFEYARGNATGENALMDELRDIELPADPEVARLDELTLPEWERMLIGRRTRRQRLLDIGMAETNPIVENETGLVLQAEAGVAWQTYRQHKRAADRDPPTPDGC